MSSPTPSNFEALASKPDEALDVARIALALAADAYPDLDAGVYLAWLDATAESIADAADRRMPLPDRLEMLDRQLFEVEGSGGTTTTTPTPATAS